MAGLPKKMFYVKILPGGTPLKYRQKGGGTYTDEKYAKSQYATLKAHGSNVELLEAEVNWVVVESSKDNPMEGKPGLW
ncbi:hypothetical protein SEA_FAUST_155 [Streptomyces phage Faust]|uniref:Uncharacterized protein n=1 Tax=Streptomyces phage Faust TaxID=2767565 RepID=A0A7G9UYX9_9CAUD|nr:hypothetical protein PP456_gp125 [Streptomyces phage Faust]QNN99234.1 hypothetical protein SEA_FAUST_155 [Streptomyces phage Faust]